jgi:serine/threonine-protein kinase
MLYDIDEFKRNPSIHFAYKYFVDETPTRFVDAITRVKGSDPSESDDAMDNDENNDEDGKKKNLPVIPILAAVAGAFVLVALLFVGVVTLFGLMDGPSTDEVIVPDLIGKDYRDILNDEELKDKFEFAWQENISDTIPKYQIINQEPRSPKSVKRKSKITLYVSSGPEMIKVPEVTKNEHKDVVKDRLEDAGFEVVTTYQTSNEVSQDFVIKIDPVSGEQLAKGSKVTMFVSSGKEPKEDKAVPNVVATRLEEAKSDLKNAGFEVGEIKYENHPQYEKDYVISQDPAKDSMKQPGTKVNLVVATGFKNYSLAVALPDTTAALDMCVYIDGALDSSFSKNNFIPLHSEILNLKAKKEQYTVLVKLRKNGTTEWKSYKEYVVNSVNQVTVSERTLTDDSEFDDGAGTTTTTSSYIPAF